MCARPSYGLLPISLCEAWRMGQEVKEHELCKWVSRAGHASMSCPCLLASANGLELAVAGCREQS